MFKEGSPFKVFSVPCLTSSVRFGAPWFSYNPRKVSFLVIGVIWRLKNRKEALSQHPSLWKNPGLFGNPVLLMRTYGHSYVLNG